MNASGLETGSAIESPERASSPSQNVLSKDEVSRILVDLGLATLLGGIEGNVDAPNVKTAITHFSEFLIHVLPGLTESTLVTDMLSIVPKQLDKHSSYLEKERHRSPSTVCGD
jgi:hypothetical protein